MWTKPAARMPRACTVRNCFHVGPVRRDAGPIPAAARICQTVEAAIGWPSLTSSPCTRRCPRAWIAGRDAGHELADRGGRGRPPGTPTAGSPTYARPAAGARRAASPGSPRTPDPAGSGEPIATVLPTTACRPAGNGPGRSGGEAPRSRAGAPRARRPWTPDAGSAPSGAEQATNEQVDDRNDHSAMSPAGKPVQAKIQ
jgi:hypothetical protein